MSGSARPGRDEAAGGSRGDDDVGRQQVAAPGHRLENPLCVVPNGATNVADTLRYAVVGDRDIGPDRPIDGIAVEQPSGVLHKKPQQFEGLSPKRKRLTRRRQQRPTPDVQNEAREAVGRHGGRGVHGVPPDSAGFSRLPSKQDFAAPATDDFRGDFVRFSPGFQEFGRGPSQCSGTTNELRNICSRVRKRWYSKA